MTQSIGPIRDTQGRILHKGDIVSTLNDHVTSKITDLCEDMQIGFVRLRPVHQSRGRGIWYAADHVLRIRHSQT